MHKMRSGVFEGEIREVDVRADELPEDHCVIGRTTMSIDDIRVFNSELFDTMYKMNMNDCRHYVNAVCSHAIGSEKRINWTLRLVQSSCKGDSAHDGSCARKDGRLNSSRLYGISVSLFTV